MSNVVLEILTAVRQVASRARVRQALQRSVAEPPDDERSNAASTSSAASAIRGGSDTLGGGDVTASAVEGCSDIRGTGAIAVIPPKPPSVEGDLVEGFLEWGTGYALNNLARAQDNDSFASVVEQLEVGWGGLGSGVCRGDKE